jgi:hypothetical protein
MKLKVRTASATCMATILVLLLLASPTLGFGGMASTHYQMPWSTLSGGNGSMASAGFTMQGTIAQASIDTAQSSNHRLSSGYWPAAGADHEDDGWHTIYLPLVVRSFP